jgi:hypothetical protein
VACRLGALFCAVSWWNSNAKYQPHFLFHLLGFWSKPVWIVVWYWF